jgi:hypothetical protein
MEQRRLVAFLAQLWAALLATLPIYMNLRLVKNPLSFINSGQFLTYHHQVHPLIWVLVVRLFQFQLVGNFDLAPIEVNHLGFHNQPTKGMYIQGWVFDSFSFTIYLFMHL